MEYIARTLQRHFSNFATLFFPNTFIMFSQDRRPCLPDHRRSGASCDQTLHDFQHSLAKLEEDFNNKLDAARAQTSVAFGKERGADAAGKKIGIRIQDLLNG